VSIRANAEYLRALGDTEGHAFHGNQYSGATGSQHVKSLHEERKRMMDIQLKKHGTIHAMNADAREKEIVYELRRIRQMNPEHFQSGTLKPK